MKTLPTVLAYLALIASLSFGFVVLTAQAGDAGSAAPATIDMLVSLL